MSASLITDQVALQPAEAEPPAARPEKSATPFTARNILLAVMLAGLIFSCPLLAQEEQAQDSSSAASASPADTSQAPSATDGAAPNAAQSDATPQPAAPSPPAKDDRLLYTLPNYLTVENQPPGTLAPLHVRDKFRLVAKDSFDIAEYPFLGFQAAIAQARNSPPEFGHHFLGYPKRYGVAFADNTIGNFMTEAVFPSLLRQDPRYYEKGHGNFFRRLGYTLSRSLITRGDSGRTEFNYSEITGNAIAAGISNLYYPRATRNWSNTVQNWWVQIGWDTTANLLREFWPDLHRMISRKKNN